jgi:DNA adenine methylase
MTLLPPDIRQRRYVEPMVGGGALFFALQPHQAVLVDANVALILAYHHVKYGPEELLGYLTDWAAIPYDSMREDYRKAVVNGHIERASQAARFIWLNKMCFNGLYRVNKAGEFNVPKGSRTVLPDLRPAIEAASKTLQAATLHAADFEHVVAWVKSSDFVYFDPPYLGDDSFTAYTQESFDLGDHAHMRWVMGRLDKKGVPWMLSSSDHPTIRVLYDGYDIREVKARRSINSDGNGRGEVTELVIRNY